jgi:hypothetical protein
MRNAKDAQGAHLFQPSDIPSQQQVVRKYSSLAANRRKAADPGQVLALLAGEVGKGSRMRTCNACKQTKLSALTSATPDATDQISVLTRLTALGTANPCRRSQRRMRGTRWMEEDEEDEEVVHLRPGREEEEAEVQEAVWGRPPPSPWK